MTNYWGTNYRQKSSGFVLCLCHSYYNYSQPKLHFVMAFKLGYSFKKAMMCLDNYKSFANNICDRICENRP